MAIGFGFRSSLSRHSQTVNEHEHTHSLMRVATAGLTSLCVCVHVSPVVATLIKLCVCVCPQVVPLPQHAPTGPRPGPSYKFRPTQNPQLYNKRHPPTGTLGRGLSLFPAQDLPRLMRA